LFASFHFTFSFVLLSLQFRLQLFILHPEGLGENIWIPQSTF
jgi:hypothetical protein